MLILFLVQNSNADNDFIVDTNHFSEERDLLNVYEYWEKADQAYQSYYNNNQHLSGDTELEREYNRLEGIRYAAELFLASVYRFNDFEQTLQKLSTEAAKPARMSHGEIKRWQQWHRGALTAIKIMPESVQNNNKKYAMVLVLMDRIAQVIDGDSLALEQKQRFRFQLAKQKHELALHKKQLKKWSNDLQKSI